MTARPNDFGRTLYTGGAREGAYLDIPVLGPSTERDFAGTVVDFFTDPMQFAVPSDKRYIIWTADAGKKLNYRYKYKGTVDSLLYGSADSNGQLRLYYLENRRYQLGESSANNTYNPYEDSNGK
ncbi:VacJ family lipoprotein [Thioclava sp. BHET1]|nr:VacJ family lipoprotein [Thioclava sp. BHET1]